MERKHAPWFWLGWVPRGPAGSLRFAHDHSELHSGEVSIHPLKNRVTKRKPQRRLSEAIGEKIAPQHYSCRSTMLPEGPARLHRCPVTVSCCSLAPSIGCSRRLQAHHQLVTESPHPGLEWKAELPPLALPRSSRHPPWSLFRSGPRGPAGAAP